MSIKSGMTAWAAALAAMLTIAAAPAQAADSLETQINQTGEAIVYQKAKDSRNVVAAELQQAELWLGQAQAFLAADKDEASRTYLRRVLYMKELIDLLLEEDGVKRTLQETVEKASQAEKDANETRQKLDAALKRQTELEAMGL